jgi:cell division protein FtsN
MTYDNDPGRERLTDPVTRGDQRSGMTMVGIVAAIAVALIVGLVYFNMGESSNTADSNTPSGTTTGSSPPPSQSPPNTGNTTAPPSR